MMLKSWKAKNSLYPTHGK